MVWYGMVWYGMVWYGMVWYGMVWYGMVFKYLYSAPQQPWANRGAFGSISSKKKRQVLRSDKEVERLEHKKEARADDGRRFQKEGPAIKKDLDLAIVVLVQVTKSSRLSRERRGRKDEAEVGSRMASRRYLGATSHLGFKDNN